MVELVGNPKAVWHYIQQLSDGKVDKIEGKGLSANDYTDEEKQKLASIASGAQVNIIESIDVDGVALTPDANKNVSIDLSGKVDKIEGKGLSTNDYTNNEKQKLENIESGAQVNIIESIWIDGVEINPDQYKKISIDLSGKLDVSQKGVANGLAELDANGKVPSSQLPSYVDDVKEYDDLAHFPEIGEGDKIYVAKDTNKTYRWSGTAYVPVGSDLALGETSSTAYRGDRGKIAYDHAMAKGSAFTTGMYKFQTNAEGHVIGATEVAKSDVVGLGLPGDVQINGTSIVNANGVANIPYAYSNVAGVVKVGNGLTMDSNGVLFINKALDEQIKAGANGTHPLTPAKQHVSIYYGLSKLAGVDLKDEEVAVGTYPETSKAAIRSLIGIGFASTTTPGLAMAGGMGISANPNSGEMYISAASAAQIKAGASNYAPIVPSTQDRSVFFGLAKIAGVDLADVELSELAYPANAQSAIQSLIGIGICGYNQLGLAKVDSSYGVSADQNGRLYLVKANSAAIKAGTSERLPIAPATQHESIFYGLSKLAGVDLAEDSEVVLGTYPSTSKEAICSLIGAAPTDNPVFTGSISLGRKANTTVGIGSFAVGYNVSASSSWSHAEGYKTTASGMGSHSEGYNTKANSSSSHAEGDNTTAKGQASHAEGYYTNANGDYSHVSGKYSISDSINSWPTWEANTSYSVGDKIKHNDNGYECIADNEDSSWDPTNWRLAPELNYAEIIGNGTANNARSNARTLDWHGNERLMGDLYVGCNADSTGGIKVAVTVNPVFTGSISLGRRTETTVGEYSTALGYSVEASGEYSHAEGAVTKASGYSSHAEGYSTQATNTYSHSEGYSTKSQKVCAHAEGNSSIADGECSHVEGYHTKSNGAYSHVGGIFNAIDDLPNLEGWIGGTSYAIGDKVKYDDKSYVCKTANSDSSFDSSKWTIDTKRTYAEIIGNGTANNARSNARTLDWEGNGWYAGNLTAAGGYLTLGSGNNAVTISAAQLQALLNLASATGVSF